MRKKGTGDSRFAYWLSTLRANQQMSQADLAQKAQTSPSMISQIERGARGMGSRLRPRLAQALGVPESQFFEEIPTEDESLKKKLDLPERLNDSEKFILTFIRLYDLVCHVPDKRKRAQFEKIADIVEKLWIEEFGYDILFRLD